LALSETSVTTDGVPPRAGEPSILNDIISLIGLLLKLLVLSRVTSQTSLLGLSFDFFFYPFAF